MTPRGVLFALWMLTTAATVGLLLAAVFVPMIWRDAAGYRAGQRLRDGTIVAGLLGVALAATAAVLTP